MPTHATGDVILIRHAPTTPPGRLYGRTDADAALPDPAALDALRAAAGPVARLVTSPARRCGQTAAALWPDAQASSDARLWEQDFGAFDGAPLADLPDLGPLPRTALAAHRWERGESFDDMAARIGPALRDWAEVARRAGPVAIVAHAGTVRAALALALDGTAPALAFAVAPLSLTRLTAFEGGFGIGCVNWTPAPA